MPVQAEFTAGAPDQDAPASTARSAVFMTAAVCPGAGHFVQRRWVAGALFLAAFVAGLVMTLLAVLAPLAANLRIVLDFAEKGGEAVFRVVSPVKVLAWFGAALLVYLAALADVVAFARRQARRRLAARQKNLDL